MQEFTFQQPPKHRQRRCILRQRRRTVPHVRTGDTECVVACGRPSCRKRAQQVWTECAQVYGSATVNHVQFCEHWHHVLVLPFGVDQPSSGVQNILKSRRQPSTQTSQCFIAIVKTCQDKRLHKWQQHRSSDRAFDTANLSESCKAAWHSFRDMSCHGDVRV